MIKLRDAYLDTEEFDFQINTQGVVQLSFGPTHVCMTLNSAYELQYELASFLANLELNEYPNDQDLDDPSLAESKKLLRGLSSIRKTRRLLDA